MRTLLSKSLMITVLLCLGCAQTPGTPTKFADTDALLNVVKQTIKQITIEEFKKMMDAEDPYVLIDVRLNDEHDAGYIPGTVNIPRGVLEFRIANEAFWEDEGMYVPLKEDNLIIYCRSGNRSALATQSLDQLGFSNVYSLEGGFRAWHKSFPELTQNKLPVIEQAATGHQVAAEEDAGGC
ncbi:MAG: rhodanese-like domain-containing protein [Cyclobacteriaceae bacterium]